ncbi:MAG: glycoside hydrolase family 57 protein [Syntrophorhabdaceae bacterium]|nr:glycoside hydrolase family 57 protein [Syntrophorhabdaceae bacterium]
METIYLSFLWHMHQPFYKNLYTGEYILPWVLLHGTKDYYDMPYLLKEFEGIRQTFNLVPSLLIQLVDYEDVGVKDRYLELFRKPSRELTEEDKIFLLKNFFNANWDNMIRPYPRYFELLKRRGFYYSKEQIGDKIPYFSDDDLRDIQVFFFLSWIDPMFSDRYEEIRRLKAKGRYFTEEDKSVLIRIINEIIRGIIPLYRELSEKGIIELSTSPFYHPIIPLLIDNTIAKVSNPDCRLPDKPFMSREDASSQIGRAKELFYQMFNTYPKGMWPPEGSVSDEALELYMEHNVGWVASDEEILFNSLNIELRRDGEGFISNPDVLYRPYYFEREGRRIHIVFRDKGLSDLISFHYSRFDPKDAASDLIRRIKKIGERVKNSLKRPTVFIIMDGENAWEYYRNDGIDFFRYLYDGLSKEKSISCRTISEAISEGEEARPLSRCFPGSWINHNFSIWIGHIEDNMSWSLLTETREYLEKNDPEKKNDKAWESLYIAEGSDWNWWYGDDHSSENDEIFDYLFRENISNVYRFLGVTPPEKLNIPILLEEREVRPTREPVNFIHPIIDGRVTNYFEWMGSGFLEAKGHGVAMHETFSLIKGCYFGFNERFFYLRLDFDKFFLNSTEDIIFEITISARDTHLIAYNMKDRNVDSPFPVQISFADILEMEVPIDVLGVKAKDRIDVWVIVKTKETTIGRIPQRGFLTITVPSENFEMEMWYV